jgi:hypothetical protein
MMLGTQRILLIVVLVVSIAAFMGLAVHRRQAIVLEEHFAAKMTAEGDALLCDSSTFGRCRGKMQSLDEGLRMTKRDPGSMIESRNGKHDKDRYGIGQYPNGTMRMYAAADFAPSKITTSFANSDGTFQDVMTVRKDGTVNMNSKQGNTAKLCIDAQCLTKQDIIDLKKARVAPASAMPVPKASPAPVAPAAKASPAPVPQPVCKRPKDWCVHPGSKYSVVDCVGNGTKGDHVCTDTAGKRGMISRATNCKVEWPNADLSKCKNLPACPRPKDWCTQGATYQAVDCVGNGTKGDHICTDAAGNRGLISRATNCKNDWPKADFSKCKVLPACPRPKDWCTHGAKYQAVDCVGNGVLGDHVCTDAAGKRGMISRATKCKNDWPSADLSKCKGLPRIWKPADNKPPASFKQVTQSGPIACGVANNNDVYCKAGESAPWKKLQFGIKNISVWGKRACGVNAGDKVFCTNDILGKPNWYQFPAPISLKQLEITGERICGVNASDNIYCAQMNGDFRKVAFSQRAGQLKQISLVGQRACGVNSADNIYCTDNIDKPATDWVQLDGSKAQLSMSDKAICGVNSAGWTWCRASKEPSTPWERRDDDFRTQLKHVSMDRSSTAVAKNGYGVGTDGSLKTAKLF